MPSLVYFQKAQAAQPNGRAVGESQEEAILSEEIVPHHHPPSPEVKAEKAAEVTSCGHKVKAMQRVM